MPTEFNPPFFEPPTTPTEFVQVDHDYDNTAGNTLTATFGATATSGSLLLALYYWSDGDGAAPSLPAAPTGYLTLYSQQTAAPVNNFACFYKISDGTETSVTIGAGGALTFIEVSGVNTANPITAFNVNNEESTDGVRIPATGTLVVSPEDAILMGHWGYSDNDHFDNGPSQVAFVDTDDDPILTNDASDFYTGQVGVGGEDFHTFTAWAQVTDQTSQAIQFTPNNTTTEGNIAAAFVINLDPVVDFPETLELGVGSEEVSSDSGGVARPGDGINVVFEDPSSDSGGVARPGGGINVVFEEPSSESGGNARPGGGINVVFETVSGDSRGDTVSLDIEVALEDVEEGAVEEDFPETLVIELDDEAVSSDSGGNVRPGDGYEFEFEDVSGGSLLNATPLTVEAEFLEFQEPTDPDAEACRDAFLNHVIDGYRIEDIFRILLANAAGSIVQQPNGEYTIFRPLSNQVQIEGEPDANNGREITDIDITPP